MKTLIFLLPLLCSCLCSSQSVRDSFIKDSIHTILNTELINDINDYNVLKARIAALDKEYGYETNLHRRMLEAAYYHNDLHFLKKDLSILVEHYGFHVSYMTGNENYYEAIMTGSLSGWFKKMYIKKNAKWLRNNFTKQVELRKLNEIHEKDQLLTLFAMKVLNVPGIDSIQQENIKLHLADYYYKNFTPVMEIATKYNDVPNEKKFAVLQNGYDTALIHNFQFGKNLQQTWDLLFPYYKKAYINNEITDVVFRNFDFYCYLQHGYQWFDSFTISQIPDQFKKNNNNPIPVKDPDWLEKIKLEFKWK